TASFFFTEDDLKLGELIRKNVPCAEKIKMQITGTEAVQTAIRIGRAYTGKSMILKFAECFHGWIDNIFGGTYDPNVQGMPIMRVPETDGNYTPGRGMLSTQETLVIPFNDFDILEDTFKKYGHLIAICHFEAVPINDYSIQPKPGFVQKIRELCDEYNVVMSMDEVLTGFRVGPGGAQGYFNVVPDLTIFGKIVAGGYPSAGGVGGKKEFVSGMAAGVGTMMKRAYVGGTLAANPLSAYAGYCAIQEIVKTNACEKAGLAGDRLVAGLQGLVDKYALPFVVYNQGSIVHLECSGAMSYDFSSLNIAKSAIPMLKTKPEMLRRKVAMEEMGAAYMAHGIVTLAGSRLYTSLADTDEVIDEALNKFEDVFKTVTVCKRNLDK
ncbi:MAG: aminotransferase class III-fold pyridoxal phosphate-dependent enzyme, partial [Clostridia bacterium]|nr:aminotransferase class III-fold pyridoxal phosphate-dependent enzyme [Clostridia bacterium]